MAKVLLWVAWAVAIRLRRGAQFGSQWPVKWTYFEAILGKSENRIL